MIKSLCVFCGSSPGFDPVHGEAARALGQALGRAGIDLVYGGGKVGLMGIVADAAMAAGVRATGVIPHALTALEVEHRLGELLLQGKNNLNAPWLAFTGFFIIALMLSLLVFIGEAVRDAFNPRRVPT